MTEYRPDRRIGGMTNEARVNSVMPALSLWASSQGLEGESLETIVGDLLCNLAHLATATGLAGREFLETVHRNGLWHFEAEAFDEPHEDIDGGIGDEPEPLEEPAIPEDTLRELLSAGRAAEVTALTVDDLLESVRKWGCGRSDYMSAVTIHPDGSGYLSGWSGPGMDAKETGFACRESMKTRLETT